MPRHEKRNEAKSEQTERIQPFDEWEEDMVDKRARSLIGKYGYMDRDQDFRDIRQELFVAILEKQDSFPKDADRKTIIKRIIDDQASWMIKKRKSAKERVNARAVSLSGAVDETFEGQPLSFEDILVEDQSLARAGGLSLEQQVELKEMIETIFESLTPVQKRVFLKVKELGSKTKAAQELGISRRAVTDVLARIRKMFAQRTP